MRRRLLLFAALFAAVAAAVVWDRANLGLVSSKARADARAAAAAESPRPDDPDEIVLVIGGGHDASAESPRPAPRAPHAAPPSDRGRRAAAPPVEKDKPRAAEKPPIARPRLVRVAPGDTLRSIATRELGDPSLWESLARANGIDDPRRLRVGDELVIPPPADR